MSYFTCLIFFITNFLALKNLFIDELTPLLVFICNHFQFYCWVAFITDPRFISFAGADMQSLSLLLFGSTDHRSALAPRPRGKRNFWIDNKDEHPAIEIEKITLQQSGYNQLMVEQGNAMGYNHAVFEDIHNLCVSGWRNPYLCV